MRPDNTAAIILAARQRHQLTRAKAIRALRELDHDGAPVTFQAVARTAGVSRSWRNGQPDLRVGGHVQVVGDLAGRAAAQDQPVTSRSRLESP
jgi:hypothetical protein